MRGECADDSRIVLRTAASPDEVNRLFASHAFAVLPILSHGIEAVDDRQYSRSQRNVFSCKPIGIAFPIPTLVMMSDYWYDRVRELYSAQDLRAGNRVDLHLLEL